MNRSSPSTQYITSRRMGIYEPMPLYQISIWDDFRGTGYQNTSPSMILEVDGKLDNQSENPSHETIGLSSKYDQEANKPVDKVLRRLTQNREAARKSRLHTKAYVQQLESSCLKLPQVEQELERIRQQGAYIGGGLDASRLGCSGVVKSGIAAFELEYGNWIEEQNRQICDLRTTLNSDLADIELHVLVDGGMKHYFELFRMKATAAKADVIYIMSGMWKTSAERFFMWIGGCLPSELLMVLLPHLELSEQQLLDVYNLKQSCQQAEDALSQGMDKLQQSLVDAVSDGQLGGGFFIPHVSNAVEQLELLVSFVNQADYIRQETLHQLHRSLSIRQAAQGLLALGEYFQRLRALSYLWTTLPREPTNDTAEEFASGNHSVVSCLCLPLVQISSRSRI